MAEIPAGASLLFGALADSGRIKQRKNGKIFSTSSQFQMIPEKIYLQASKTKG